jgi:3-dehydroquinate dehydratase
MLIPYFCHHDNEVRSFLKKLFQIPADIIPDYEAKELKLRFHCMQTNHEQELLRKICTINNEREIIFPETDLRLVYEVL